MEHTTTAGALPEAEQVGIATPDLVHPDPDIAHFLAVFHAGWDANKATWDADLRPMAHVITADAIRLMSLSPVRRFCPYTALEYWRTEGRHSMDLCAVGKEMICKLLSADLKRDYAVMRVVVRAADNLVLSEHRPDPSISTLRRSLLAILDLEEVRLVMRHPNGRHGSKPNRWVRRAIQDIKCDPAVKYARPGPSKAFRHQQRPGTRKTLTQYPGGRCECVYDERGSWLIHVVYHKEETG